MRKYGTAEPVLKDEEEQQEQKTAASNWTEEDREELEVENREADEDE